MSMRTQSIALPSSAISQTVTPERASNTRRVSSSPVRATTSPSPCSCTLICTGPSIPAINRAVRSACKHSDIAPRSLASSLAAPSPVPSTEATSASSVIAASVSISVRAQDEVCRSRTGQPLPRRLIDERSAFSPSPPGWPSAPYETISYGCASGPGTMIVYGAPQGSRI